MPRRENCRKVPSVAFCAPSSGIVWRGRVKAFSECHRYLFPPLASSTMSSSRTIRRTAAVLTLALVGSLGSAAAASATATSTETVTGEVLTVEVDDPNDPDRTDHLISTTDGELVPVDLPASLEDVETGSQIVAEVVPSGDDGPSQVVS